ncbi:MAG: tRNA dihydrouridine synthase DusB [Clostridia bacterium]|nr:tRNA dihydrouridine synthase DusB [Clostridia bacterium]
MTISSFFAGRPLLLAPMAGYTDAVFRRLCREEGCDLAFTEMISAKGLLHANKKTRLLCRPGPQEGPLGVQLFGSDPVSMGVAARVVTEELGDSLFCLDINCGCPARKIAGNGDGSALLLDLPLAEQVISSVVRHTTLPVSVKYRSGWDEAHMVSTDFARMAEAAGASFLTLHPRTRAQQYSGSADWNEIAAAKAAVRIPVVGNGDIVDGPSALRMLEETGCDGLMIGRGALGRPWIFSEVRAALKGEPFTPPDGQELNERILRHGELELLAKGDHGMVELRKHLPLYFTGRRGASALKKALSQVKTMAELRDLLLDRDRADTYNSMN